MTSIGERLKYIRKDLLKKSQIEIVNDLAPKIMLTDHTLSRYETEEREITIKFMIAFCDLYNINLNYLISGVFPVFKESNPKRTELDLIVELIDTLKNSEIELNKPLKMSSILADIPENYLFVLKCLVNSPNFRKNVFFMAFSDKV